MLAEVEASRISTAELDMQAAPAVAAATGGIVFTGIVFAGIAALASGGVLRRSHDRNVMTKSWLW
jgi:predicted transcriptional regulator